MTLTTTGSLRARPWAARSVQAFTLAAAAVAGCSDAGSGLDEPLDDAASIRAAAGAQGAWLTPALRNPVSIDDDELAERALRAMGSAAVGASGSCGGCHAIGRPTLTRWARLTNDFTRSCLQRTALADSAAVDAMFDCFRAHAKPASSLESAQFGIYAAAAHLPWFTFLFEHGGDDAQARQRDFVARVGMPRAGTPWTQAQFDDVAEWFARGLPGLFERVPEDSGEECEPGLAPELAAHVEQMAASGWRAKNEQLPLLMLGCDDEQTGADCLSDRPLASDALGVSWEGLEGSHIRLLFDNSETRSSYWSRSSADGRYIGSGRAERGADGYLGQFVDLARDEVIGADFSYDATFFPDGSGFLVQRGGGDGNTSASGITDGSADPGDVALVCEQSVLADARGELSGDEEQCSQVDSQIGLYQQLAKSLDGDDYWVVFGSYGGDNGGFEPVLENPVAAFEARSATSFVPMLNLGASFEAGVPVRVSTPEQGDPMLSPSGRLLVTRVKGAEHEAVIDGQQVVSAQQSGYALHLVESVREGDDWGVELTDVGRICLQGGKAVVSYDERWLVFHHYVTGADARTLGFSGPDDPEFEQYLELGAANLYLVDLRDGTSRTLTAMGAGQYALFPHFRSDGWIYFVMRTLDGAEYFAASDAALRLDAAGGG